MLFRSVRALDYLAQQGWLELKAEGVRNRFRRLPMRPELDGLAQRLYGRALERETREISRLLEVLALAAHSGCLVSRLGEHFGEPLPANCGHCSWCLNSGQSTPLLPRPVPGIDESVLARATALRAEHPDLVSEPRALTRFLCGITSPKLSRARLTSHPLFGSLAHAPFADVLARTQAL